MITIPSTDFIIQATFLLITLGIFLSLLNFPKKALNRLRSKSNTTTQSNRHFITGAHLLTRAKSAAKNRSVCNTLTKAALAEADRALAFQPKDPASHILKALAQDQLGHKSAAIKSLDVALSKLVSKRLSDRERADALVKRAELLIALNRRRRVDSAISDLVEAVELFRKKEGQDVDVKVYCLLGQCYELKGMKDEAIKAYEDGLEVEPSCTVARDGLVRLKV